MIDQLSYLLLCAHMAVSHDNEKAVVKDLIVMYNLFR